MLKHDGGETLTVLKGSQNMFFYWTPPFLFLFLKKDNKKIIVISSVQWR